MATRLKLRLKGSREDAVKLILDNLPKDSIVRGEDDGVGRFAGERTLVIVGRGEKRLMLFSGTYGSIKGRLEEPHLDVQFEEGEGGTTVRLVREPEKKPSLVARVFDLIGYIITVAAVVVAYHLFRKLEIDTQRTALVSVAGGLAWAAIAHYMPKREDVGLQEVVTKALAPITRKKKPKKPAEEAPPKADDDAAPARKTPARETPAREAPADEDDD